MVTDRRIVSANEGRRLQRRGSHMCAFPRGQSRKERHGPFSSTQHASSPLVNQMSILLLVVHPNTTGCCPSVEHHKSKHYTFKDEKIVLQTA